MSPSATHLRRPRRVGGGLLSVRPARVSVCLYAWSTHIVQSVGTVDWTIVLQSDETDCKTVLMDLEIEYFKNAIINDLFVWLRLRQ